MLISQIGSEGIPAACSLRQLLASDTSDNLRRTLSDSTAWGGVYDMEQLPSHCESSTNTRERGPPEGPQGAPRGPWQVQSAKESHLQGPLSC